MDVKPTNVTATLLDKKQLNDRVWELHFHIDQPETFQFIPGQYGTVMIDKTTRRLYSFASAPSELPTMTFVIDVTPMGPGSKYFLALAPGERMEMIAPLGKFALADSPRKKVFVATGTGIAPFRSMLLNEISNFKFQISNRSLYWGLRYEEDIYWKDEMEALIGQYSGSKFYLSLSKPVDAWQGLTGHITDHVFEKEKDLKNSEFYLCGNRSMIEEMEMKLKSVGISSEMIKVDLFY